MKAAVVALLVVLASPALAQDEDEYLDDRSTPEAVIESYYNAVNRHEYARAYSYYEDGEGVADYEAFADGYADTVHVDLILGEAAEEGAAGSTFYSVPVVIDAEDTDGDHSAFAGCFTLRLAQPAIQEPPFRPLHIVEGRLHKAKSASSKSLPDDCGP